MNNSKPIIALLLVTTILGAPLSGCLEPNDENLNADSLLIEIIGNEIAQGGFFQDFEFRVCGNCRYGHLKFRKCLSTFRVLKYSI